MKYKQFLSIVRDLYTRIPDKIVTSSSGYWNTNQQSFITEVVYHCLSDLSLEELAEESKHVESVFREMEIKYEDYSFDMYMSRCYVLNKCYYTTKETHKKLYNIKETFQDNTKDFLYAISCNNSDFADHIPANNWRLCKIFKVKPASKINPKLVIPDEYIDKIVATYFDLIRHGLITNED